MKSNTPDMCWKAKPRYSFRLTHQGELVMTQYYRLCRKVEGYWVETDVWEYRDADYLSLLNGYFQRN